jgi:hypothetical protein
MHLVRYYPLSQQAALTVSYWPLSYATDQCN